jgi:hypothetical protein
VIAVTGMPSMASMGAVAGVRVGGAVAGVGVVASMSVVSAVLVGGVRTMVVLRAPVLRVIVLVPGVRVHLLRGRFGRDGLTHPFGSHLWIGVIHGVAVMVVVVVLGVVVLAHRSLLCEVPPRAAVEPRVG